MADGHCYQEIEIEILTPVGLVTIELAYSDSSKSLYSIIMLWMEFSQRFAVHCKLAQTLQTKNNS
jgi:hypothetical protein